MRALLLLLIMAGGLAVVEMGFRIVLLPQNFLYLESSYFWTPKHRLVRNFDQGGVTIRDGKRSVPQDGPRLRAIAVVGDSVAFGSGLATDHVLANLIQARQSEFNVENFGVPGYGLRDYVNVIRGLPESTYDIIVVQVSANDPYPATAGHLGLLVDGDGATVFFNDYADGDWKRLKTFLFKYLKFLYFVLTASRPDVARPGSSEGYVESAGIVCADAIEDQLQAAPNFLRSYRVQNTIYADEAVRRKLLHDFSALKRAAAEKARRLVVIKNYDYLHFKLGAEAYRAAIDPILSELAIETMPSDYEHHLSAWQTCGYFADPAHPGPAYNDFLVGLLLLKIAEDPR